MTRKPNLLKLILATAVLGLLFVGSWAATSKHFIGGGNLKSSADPTGQPAKANKNSLSLPLAPGDDLISSVFEVDGDIFDNPAGAPDDWSTVNCDGGTADVKTFVNDGLGTTIFTQGGSKDPSDIGVLNQQGVLQPGWRHTNGSVPDKDEILNAYAAKYTGPGGDTILAFGADRFANQGDSFFGVWFFQKNVYAAPDGTFKEQVGVTADPATDPLAQHSIGDILILMSFTAGGTFGTGEVFEWVGTGGNVKNNPTLNSITNTAPVGSVLGVINGDPAPPTNGSGPQDIPDNCAVQPGQTQSWNALYTPKPSTGSPGIIPIADFFEGAINLDAFPALRGLCLSSFLVETRSSSSVSAQLKDFVLGSFNTCPEISVTKVADDTSVCVGTPTTYTYTVNNPTGFTLNVTLVDDNETPADPSDDLDVNNNCAAIGAGSPSVFQLAGHANAQRQCTRTLSVGTHTNIVTATATLGSFSSTDTDSETVTVTPAPSVSISQLVCSPPQTGFSLTATASGGTAPYTISLDGEGCGGTGQPACVGGNTLTINRTVGGTFSATVTDANGCPATATRKVGYCSD